MIFQLYFRVIIWIDNDPKIESKYHHYNLCLVLCNNSYLEFTTWHYYSEYIFSYNTVPITENENSWMQTYIFKQNTRIAVT